MEDFFIYLTFDIDQDFDPESSNYYNRSKADFSSFKNGFKQIINVLDGLPFSVFVRADKQINELYGSYDYLIQNNPGVKKAILKSGGEINWHIHIYEERNGEWGPIKYSKSLVRAFREDFMHVNKIESINSSIVRIGECVMTNELMHEIDVLGCKIDSTALPKRKRNDKEKFFDWSETSNDFYYPLKSDYRISGENARKVLEVPMTTIKMKADYDDEAYYRYFNLSFKEDVLFQNLEKYVLSNNSLVSITHPFEVLSSANHSLISYDIEVFKKNIYRLKSMVESAGKRPVFKKISDIVK